MFSIKIKLFSNLANFKMALIKKIKKKILFAPWAAENPRWHSHQMWYTSIKDIFDSVIVFDPQKVLNQCGKDLMNKKFLEILRKEKPDYIFIWLIWEEFYPETLMSIKKILPNSKIINFCGDDDIKFDNYTTPYFPIVDYTLATQGNFFPLYDKYGARFFNALGTDTKKFFPIKGTKKKYDASFLGTDKADRLEYARHLLKNKINFAICGAGWDKYPEFKNVWKGKVSDEEFRKIMNETKINICFSKNYFNVPHAIERFLMANACKSFVLTEYAPGYYPKFTEGKDIVTFKDKEDLIKKINHYLKNEKEREKIAATAYKKTISGFSNEHLLYSAFTQMEKEKTIKKEFNEKFIYLSSSDFNKGTDHIRKKTQRFDYIFFKNNGYQSLAYKEFFQIETLKRTGKDLCLCNCYLSSIILGNYMTMDLFYAYDHLPKKYFYEHTDISQICAKREYLLKNIEKFKDMYNGKIPKFIDKDNTSMISISLNKTYKKKALPVSENNEHILFSDLTEPLILLRNSGKIFRSFYPYKLILYSMLFNHDILKFVLKNIIPKSKDKRIMKILNILKK